MQYSILSSHSTMAKPSFPSPNTAKPIYKSNDPSTPKARGGSPSNYTIRLGGTMK